MLVAGGFTMIPLVACSILTWCVIFERIWRFRAIGRSLKDFHLEAMNALLRSDRDALKRLCDRDPSLPTARLVQAALERIDSRDERVRARWQEAMERKRSLINQELRGSLWILGTIGSASPFIGLFGTVVGILGAFHNMASSGSGGFAVVASAISEALIATAAGIVVAVIAVLAYNAFQTRWSALVLNVRIQAEELAEMLEGLAASPASREKT